MTSPRRMCTLAQAPQEPQVLGKVLFVIVI